MILMVMNISLTGVVVLVIRKNEGFQYAGYLIYLMAMYAFYNIITPVMNVVKYRKYRSPVMSAAKVINLAAALVGQSAVIGFGNVPTLICALTFRQSAEKFPPAGGMGDWGLPQQAVF